MLLTQLCHFSDRAGERELIRETVGGSSTSSLQHPSTLHQLLADKQNTSHRLVDIHQKYSQYVTHTWCCRACAAVITLQRVDGIFLGYHSHWAWFCLFWPSSLITTERREFWTLVIISFVKRQVRQGEKQTNEREQELETNFGFGQVCFKKWSDISCKQTQLRL